MVGSGHVAATHPRPLHQPLMALEFLRWLRSLPAWQQAILAAGALQIAKELVERAREKSVAGEVALITGAGSGIGRLMAIKLAAQGAKVVLWDINKAAVETVGACVVHDVPADLV